MQTHKREFDRSDKALYQPLTLNRGWAAIEVSDRIDARLASSFRASESEDHLAWIVTGGQLFMMWS